MIHHIYGMIRTACWGIHDQNENIAAISVNTAVPGLRVRECHCILWMYLGGIEWKILQLLHMNDAVSLSESEEFGILVNIIGDVYWRRILKISASKSTVLFHEKDGHSKCNISLGKILRVWGSFDIWHWCSVKMTRGKIKIHRGVMQARRVWCVLRDLLMGRSWVQSMEGGGSLLKLSIHRYKNVKDGSSRDK